MFTKACSVCSKHVKSAVLISPPNTFIHSLCKSLLRSQFVPGSILGDREKMLLSPWEKYIEVPENVWYIFQKYKWACFSNEGIASVYQTLGKETQAGWPPPWMVIVLEKEYNSVFFFLVSIPPMGHPDPVTLCAASESTGSDMPVCGSGSQVSWCGWDRS